MKTDIVMFSLFNDSGYICSLHKKDINSTYVSETRFAYIHFVGPEKVVNMIPACK